METLGSFGTILILATLVEGIIEHLVKPLFFPAGQSEPWPPEKDPGQASRAAAGDASPGALAGGEVINLNPALRDILLRYASALTGCLLCLAYRADLLALAGLGDGPPLVGYAVTGIVVGRGANYLHDLVSRWGAAPSR